MYGYLDGKIVKLEDVPTDRLPDFEPDPDIENVEGVGPVRRSWFVSDGSGVMVSPDGKISI